MRVDTRRITYLTPPSPVVLVSTVDERGRKNVATYGYFTPCDPKIPSILVGVREFQHTYKNIKKTGEFVVGIPTPNIVDKVWKAGNKDEKCKDEFRETSLTPIPSEEIKPFRIKECQVNLECVFDREFKMGTHTWIIGKVIVADIHDKLFSEDNAELRRNLDSLYHVTKTHFMKGGKKIDL